MRGVIHYPVRMALSIYLLMIGGGQALPAGEAAGTTETWLGLKTPGCTPIPFAPGIVSTDENIEFTIAFSPDGREIYFTRREPDGPKNIYLTRFIDGELTDPVVAAFTCGGTSGHPFITPDGRRMFFGWRARGRRSLWVAERTENSWGVPLHVGDGMMRASVTRDGILYFTASGGGSIDSSFIARIAEFDEDEPDRQRIEFEETDLTNFVHPWISPDERLMIFDSWEAPDGYGGADLYVSHRSDDDCWSRPRNLGNGINTEAIEMTASLTPDGRFLFFSRADSIYWVDAAVMLDAKAEDDAIPRPPGGGLDTGTDDSLICPSPAPR